MSKKAEMVRRTKVLRFVKLQSKLYEMQTGDLYLTPEGKAYLDGYAAVLNALEREFDIEANELEATQI